MQQKLKNRILENDLDLYELPLRLIGNLDDTLDPTLDQSAIL